MKVGLAVGAGFGERGRKLYSILLGDGIIPDFVLFCMRKPRVRLRHPRTLIGLFFWYSPTVFFRFYSRIRSPCVPTRNYYVKGVNSDEAFSILCKENPSCVVVSGCGIVGKRLCERFPNTLLNAHAGKLPEYRGMNNVEWAYLEDESLVGTIHFMVPEIDAGDIVMEKELEKAANPGSIDEIREKAFDQVYGLFPEAIRKIREKDFSPKKQPTRRTTRYVMHPFLKRILEKKFKIIEKNSK